MSNIEVVSFAELQQEQRPIHSGVVSIDWQLALPEHAHPDRIGVNVYRLGRMASLAGLNALTVGGFTGDDLRVEPAVSGIDAKGTAIATMTGAARIAPEYRVSSSRNGTNVYYGRARESGVLGIDTEKVARHITDSRQSVWSPDAWSKELDRVTCQGLGKLATETIIRHKSSGEIAMDLAGISLLFGLAAALTLDPVTVARDLPQTFMTMNALEYLARWKHHHDAYWSLIPFIQVDRWAAVQVLTRLPLNIVRPIATGK